MSYTGAPAGIRFAHQRSLASVRPSRGAGVDAYEPRVPQKTTAPEATSARPTPRHETTSDVPPWETKGRVIPMGGATPATPSTSSKARSSYRV